MEIKRICVIGMGTMGSQIGIVCAHAGFQTFMVDASRDRIDKGLEMIRSFLEVRREKGKMEGEAVEGTLSLISTGTDMREALSPRIW